MAKDINYRLEFWVRIDLEIENEIEAEDYIDKNWNQLVDKARDVLPDSEYCLFIEPL